jgi:AcrR family transcriptional regulator
MANTTRDASAETPPARRPGRPSKRDAILTAAVRVFGRSGYARASVDAIAAEAGVSTRTIYQHFEGKEQLFTVTLETSATRVADGFVADVETVVAKQLPVEAELVAIGELLVSQPTRYAEHFAMVRQINAEAEHFPEAVLQRWRAAGPRRVEQAVAERLSAMAAAGALHFPNARRAASQFIGVTSSGVTLRSHLGARPVSRTTVRRAVAEGVDLFLHGYGT